MITQMIGNEINENHILYYRKTIVDYGLMDQLRIDGGREFYLIIGIQQHLSDRRGNQTISCYQQTQSKRVHI